MHLLEEFDKKKNLLLLNLNLSTWFFNSAIFGSNGYKKYNQNTSGVMEQFIVSRLSQIQVFVLEGFAAQT